MKLLLARLVRFFKKVETTNVLPKFRTSKEKIRHLVFRMNRPGLLNVERYPVFIAETEIYFVTTKLKKRKYHF